MLFRSLVHAQSEKGLSVKEATRTESFIMCERWIRYRLLLSINSIFFTFRIVNSPSLSNRQMLTKSRKRKHEDDEVEIIPSKIPRLETPQLDEAKDFNKKHQSYVKFLDEFEQFLLTLNC